MYVIGFLAVVFALADFMGWARAVDKYLSEFQSNFFFELREIGKSLWVEPDLTPFDDTPTIVKAISALYALWFWLLLTDQSLGAFFQDPSPTALLTAIAVPLFSGIILYFAAFIIAFLFSLPLHFVYRFGSFVHAMREGGTGQRVFSALLFIFYVPLFLIAGIYLAIIVLSVAFYVGIVRLLCLPRQGFVATLALTLGVVAYLAS